jgi:hypothetical protein
LFATVKKAPQPDDAGGPCASAVRSAKASTLHHSCRYLLAQELGRSSGPRGHLRNVDTNYSFERSHRFAGIQPNSDFRDYSRLSCGVGDTQLGRAFWTTTPTRRKVRGGGCADPSRWRLIFAALLANAEIRVRPYEWRHMMLPRGTLESGDGIGQPLIGVISAAAHRPAATLSNVKGKREAPSLPANVTCSHSSQMNLSEPAMWVSGISWVQSCKC